ncbi:MAG TPA: tripartite tricarboxylate transporter substrate binding protein [Burkholderiales bacterium]|nr:tripartite tricarboxylate transporter substrate binding protein [Burkholderiales bacterium]
MRWLAALVLALVPALADAQTWKPQKTVEIVSSAGAGGSADRGARTVQRYLQALPGMPSVIVTNRTGGGGSVAFTFISQHAGDAHFLGTMATNIVTNHIVGVSPLSYRDFTPLNILMREYVVVSVLADSPLASAKDLLARLRKDPGAITFGFAAAPGNQNHVVIGMIARAAGVDPKALKTVVFNSGSAAATAMLGGHVNVLVGTPGTVAPHLAAGKARAIGISAPQRQREPYASTATLRENGIDAVYYSWRGFLAPRGITPAQVAFWEQAFAKVVDADEWKQDLQKNVWIEDFRSAAETRKHLDAEYELLKTILVELGVVR